MKRKASHLCLCFSLCLAVAIPVLAQGDATAKRVLERSRAYEPLMREAATRYGIDARLLWVIAYLETRFNPSAVSPKGARGLMQFMPATAARYGLSDAHDAAAAIEAAARYLRDLLRRYGGRVDLALAAYNAGEATVDAYLTGRTINTGTRIINAEAQRTDGIPPYAETRAYVRLGMKLLNVPGNQRRSPNPVESVTNTQAAKDEAQEGTPLPRGLVRQSLFVQTPDQTISPTTKRSLFFTATTK